ncbi:MAG: cytochrome c4 [Telluria sp.]
MTISSKLIRIALLAGALLGDAATAADKPADTIAQRALACVACHGKDGRATSDGFFPRIAGKPAGYLYNQLINFRDGTRSYPLMTYMVGHMSDEYLKEIAQYFSEQHPPYAAPQPVKASADSMTLGRRLVLTGDASRKIPACIACHGETLRGALPAIPSLLGLPRDYVNAQIGAWKNGARKAKAPDCMAHISKQLSADEVGAISSWLAAQPIPRDMTPAPAASVTLPTSCGSAQ